MVFAFIGLIIASITRGLQAVFTFPFYANYKNTSVPGGSGLDGFAIMPAVHAMMKNSRIGESWLEKSSGTNCEKVEMISSCCHAFLKFQYRSNISR